MSAKTHSSLHATLVYLGIARKRQVRERDRWVTWLDLTGNLQGLIQSAPVAQRRASGRDRGAFTGAA
jgi:hypothetical protein